VEMANTKAAPATWKARMKLPSGHCVHYKYVVVRSSTEDALRGQITSGQVEWEMTDGDRRLDVHGTDMKVDDDSFGVYDAANESKRVKEWNSGPLSGRKQVTESPKSELRTPTRRTGTDSPFPDDSTLADTLIVLYRLPINGTRDPETNKWVFDWDDDALYLTSLGVRRALGQDHVKWVGILNVDEDVDPSEYAEVEQELLKFNCYPVFIPREKLKIFYQGFCKRVLWPAFHMNASVTDEGKRMKNFDYSAWEVYKEVNFMFAAKTVAAYQIGELIWVHDYHLMVLPAELRSKIPGAKIGFFLHIPWPSSETYRELPVRDEILRGVLSSSLLGFHLFDYARHFLSSCRRMLKLDHEARRGLLGVEYMGRHVNIRVSHIGIDPTRFTRALQSDEVQQRVSELENQYSGKSVIGGVDDLDQLKGISLKLMAFETLLDSYRVYRNNLVLIQVAIPKKARVKNFVQKEIRRLVDRINTKYGSDNYRPVVYIEKDISFVERVALFRTFDLLLLTPIRDGLNLIPYEYIAAASTGKGQLILSEFTGCSRALSGAARINPWNIEEIVQRIDSTLQEMQAKPDDVVEKHTKDLNYVTAHSTAVWAESFLSDLQKSSAPVSKVIKLGTVAPVLGQVNFEAYHCLNFAWVGAAYRRAKRRLFLLDYDGTLTSGTLSSRMAHEWAFPDDEVFQALHQLANNPKNIVFIMSGRAQKVLSSVFQQSSEIGLAAEHGFSYRFPKGDWVSPDKNADLSWKPLAKEIMERYCERTDGAYIEDKETGLVWHFGDADPEFGSWQSKELNDHLTGVLATFKVQVITGKDWLQVRLADVNKAVMSQRILDWMKPDASPDFIFCAGDDRTDEDMFKVLNAMSSENIFTCSVGMRPSKAGFYVREPEDLSSGLVSLAKGTL